VLHDFGQGRRAREGARQGKKLYDEDRQSIRMRFAYIRKSLESDHAERKLRMAMELSRDELLPRFADVDADLARKLGELESAWAFIIKANEPTVLEEGGLERLVEIGQLVYMSPDGEPRPYIEREEVAALQVRRGSLTDVERVEIESHVVHTYNFLKKIPWGSASPTCRASRARTHEYLNGGGYPRHLPAADIPVESRIMTIADIFDALTASDRPYKKAVPSTARSASSRAEVKAASATPPCFASSSRARLQERSCECDDPRSWAGARGRARGDAAARGRARADRAAGAGPGNLLGDAGLHRRRRDPRAQPRLSQARSRDRRAVVSPAGARGRGRSGGGGIELGDIVISVETARRRAHGKRLVSELERLAIHGLCHLFGHDHKKKAEATVMFALERPPAALAASLKPHAALGAEHEPLVGQVACAHGGGTHSTALAPRRGARCLPRRRRRRCPSSGPRLCRFGSDCWSSAPQVPSM